ncbi:MAG: hypothetical protein ACREQT_09665 [Candidatus Binataceae bacterium]
MAQVAVVGSGPVTLTTSVGRQLSIPLTALYFDAGNVKADRWPLYKKFKADVDPWLSYLVTKGELTPSAQPAPVPAIMISAADAGQSGNNIVVTFSNITPDPANPSDPTKTTFDAIVVETDTYASLSFDPASPNFIRKILGTQTIAGSQRGLAHILDADSPSQPKPGSFQLGGGSAAAKSAAPINGDPTGTAFNLEAKKVGTDGDKTKATISNVDATGKTFSVVIVWSSQPISGLKLGDLPSKLAQSGYEISVAPPSSGFAVPTAGSISLAGGADAAAASAAAATVPAG